MTDENHDTNYSEFPRHIVCASTSNSMKYKRLEDEDALYQCLSKNYTSDSDVSELECSFPKVYEVLNVETSELADSLSCKKVKLTKGNLLRCSESQHKNEPHRRYKAKNKCEKEIKNKRIKPDVDVQSDSEMETETTVKKEKGGNLLHDIIIEEETNSYEASEDCTSDDEGRHNLPSKRRRTPSGSSIPVYECMFEGCNKEFTRPYRLMEHQRQHTGERPHRCTIEGCDRTYTRKQHLRRHMATSHQKLNLKENFKCNECGKILGNKYSLAKHCFRAHVRANYKCKDCGQTFRKQQHLRTHMYSHNGIEPYKCDYPGCELRFLVPSKLKRHAIVHAKGRYVCPIEECSQPFDKYTQLQKHLSFSHPKVCDVCGRNFKQLRHLKVHRKTHEDVREAFFCPVANCDCCFYDERNLTKHIREKHERSNIYQCGICDVRLSSKQKLAYHVTIHSPSYKRNYESQKPRKPRKDKGISKTDYACLLSGIAPQDIKPLVSKEIEVSSSQELPSTSKLACHEKENLPNKMSALSSLLQEPVIGYIQQSRRVNENMSQPILSEDDMEKLVLSSDDAVDRDSESVIIAGCGT
ncbi:hypothetical protein SK128_020231 [Halocaridina rubra]|uniref:C2H2-type domain-containing protein n=1 Tax=Halocaridina rubra TaxID=373956 RepID=A0AAN8WHZ9_HALRR